jgi:hypothetical protein
MLNEAGKAGPGDIDWGAGAILSRTLVAAVVIGHAISIGVHVAPLPIFTVFVH